MDSKANIRLCASFIFLLTTSALNLVHAGDPNRTGVLAEVSGGKRVDTSTTLTRVASQLGPDKPIRGGNDTTVINPKEDHEPAPRTTTENATYIELSSATALDPLGNSTGRNESEGFPFNSQDAHSDDYLSMMAPTCNEHEDPDCVIDHNVTCVGDIQFCNLTYDEYMDMLMDYIYPSLPEWILIISHAVVFVMGLVGNALVCIAVYTNHSMRTVTNIFIVNLAVADFFVILFCLPPTVLWDVTETWFLGRTMCKVLLYFQNVSVTVSVLTLTFISLDRWYAICFPLRYVSTNKRAVCSIALIWIVALLSDIPEFLALTTVHKELRFGSQLFTQCQTKWDDETEQHFNIIRLITLYILPLLLMTIAYFQIVRVLWKSDTIPGHRESRNHQQYNCTYLRNPCPPANSSTMGQLRTRRKAAKMLVAVVIMFAGCFFPVHCLNIVRYTYTEIGQSQVVAVLSLLSHWLCYANSAINPLIYNFMSGKFRREFKHALEKCRCGSTNRGRVEDRSMYHSAPGTRFNNISPSSRSNYQLASMRDLTRQQTLQTSFIENGNGHQHQRYAQQPSRGSAATGGNGSANGHGLGLGLNGHGSSDLLRQNADSYLEERVNGVDLLAQAATPEDGAENLLNLGSGNNSQHHSGPP